MLQKKQQALPKLAVVSLLGSMAWH